MQKQQLPLRQPSQQFDTDIYKIGGGGIPKEEASAIKLVWEGKATPHQQRMALESIIDRLAMADHISYTQGSFDGSAFLAGRAFVGKLIRTILRKPIGDAQ
jgi:hypothetical protein